MNKQICKYSIVRFLPYTETGEFVNMGIVLYVPAFQRIMYQLLNPNQHERITNFFKSMNKDLFRNTVEIDHLYKCYNTQIKLLKYRDMLMQEAQ